MCGICGTVNIGNEKKLRKMVDIIKHRGPDDQGIKSMKSKHCNVYLGNARLSIIDLSDLGHMPMQTEDARFTITYNGECYNFIQLREYLIEQGYAFKSTSDTEVILKAYQHWGHEFVHHLDGMYAIAIWDNLKEELILIRDRSGIKPLYYFHSGKAFAFASEIKSLLELDEISKDPNLNSLILMAAFFWAPDPSTAFNGIHRLPPAHYLIYKDRNVTIKRYWKPKFHPNFYGSIDEAIEDFDTLLNESIKATLISDVPVGAFVGGLDSSIIGTLAHKYYPGEFSFYTSTMPPEVQKQERGEDDLPFVKEIVGDKHIPLHVHQMSTDTAALLPRLVWHLDEPSADPCQIQYYLMSKQAQANGCKVLLSGQGADELFLGYARHKAVSHATIARTLLPKFCFSCLNRILSILPVAFGNRGIPSIRKAKRFFKSISQEALTTFVHMYLIPDVQTLKKVSPVWADDVNDAIEYMTEKHELIWGEIDSDDLRDKMSYTDALLYLSSYILFFSDKSTSAASIEVRYPFLNRSILEFAFNIPGKWKLQNGIDKYILRRVALNHLPSELAKRRKIPFPGAVRSWTRVDYVHPISKLLLSNKSGLWDPTFLKEIVELNKSGRYDYAHFIWALIRIELWFDIFINGNSFNDISFID